MQSQHACGGQDQSVGIGSFLYYVGSGDQTLSSCLVASTLHIYHLLTDPGNSLIMTPNLSIFHLLTVMKSLRDDLYDKGDDVHKTYHNKLNDNMNISCQTGTK